MNFAFPNFGYLFHDIKKYLEFDSYQRFQKFISLENNLNKLVLKITSNSLEALDDQSVFCLLDSKNFIYLDECLRKNVICFAQMGDHLLMNLENLGFSNNEFLFFISKDLNIRKFYSLIVSRFFNLFTNFGDQLKISAITGTNGKTSSTFFFKQIMNGINFPAASIGTLGVCFDQENNFFYKEEGITTPDQSKLQQIIFDLCSKEGVFNFALEASSHGINQERLSGLPALKSVCFTNFSQDHLDYHLSLEQYWSVKKRLFDEIACSKKTFACINLDDERSEILKEIALKRSLNLITYSSEQDAMIKLKNFDITSDFKLNIEIEILKKIFKFKLDSPAFFQISNLMAALSCVLAHLSDESEFFFEDIVKIFEEKYYHSRIHEKIIHSPPGRAELIRFHQSLIIVDYAHTPEALETVLLDLRKIYNNFKILTIFGCGGERDRGKRPLMGEKALKFSDFIVITSDNPRGETQEQIFFDITENFIDFSRVARIDERKDAILYGIEKLKKNEFQILLIAGKGHESFQFFENGRKENFNDFDVVKKLIE